MHPNAERIASFYEAFEKRDSVGMGAAYAPDVRFSDPVFPALVGDEARAMWTMLCKRGKDLVVEAKNIEADDATGRAEWDAHYTFSGTGKKVHNIVRAEFQFDASGRIIAHTDTFDLTRWIGQAFGVPGRLFGGLGPFHRFVQRKAAASLEAWMKGTP